MAVLSQNYMQILGSLAFLLTGFGIVRSHYIDTTKFIFEQLKKSCFDRLTYKKNLDNNDTLPMRYHAFILSLNGKLDIFFGKELLKSKKSFNRCLAIGLVYPILLFIISWLFGASGNIGNLKVLPERSFSNVFSISLALLCPIITFLFLKSEHKKKQILHLEQLADSSLNPPFEKKWFYFVYTLLSGLIGGVIGAITAVYYYPALGGIFGGGYGAIIGITLGKQSSIYGNGFVGVIIGTSMGVLLYALKVGLESGKESFVVLLTFFVILPIINTIWDWISWGATRKFLRNIEDSKTNNAGNIIKDIIYDLFIALICLIGLIISLIFVLNFLNGVYAKFNLPVFEWDAFIRQVKDKPLSSGFGITMMLASTIFPTILHVSNGLVAIALMPSKKSREVASRINKELEKDEMEGTRLEIAKFCAMRKVTSQLSSALLMLVLLGGCGIIIYYQSDLMKLIFSFFNIAI